MFQRKKQKQNFIFCSSVSVKFCFHTNLVFVDHLMCMSNSSSHIREKKSNASVFIYENIYTYSWSVKAIKVGIEEKLFAVLTFLFIVSRCKCKDTKKTNTRKSYSCSQFVQCMCMTFVINIHNIIITIFS